MVAGPRVEGRVLPALLPLTVVAAAGWQGWLDGRSRRVRSLGPGVLVAAQLLILLPFAPYFVTFANPLLGGPPVAARVIGVGRGEGMDRVAAWLNSQPETLAGTVGSDFPDTLAPYFAGRIANTGAPNLAFVVLYINRDGGEFPSQAALRYYNLLAEPAHTVRLAGLDYARIYHGPAVQPAMPLPVGMETGLLPRPLAFRPAADGPAPGDSLTVDVIWLANPDMPDTQSTLSLRDPVKFQAGLNGDDRPVALPGAIYAQAQAPLRRAAENLIVSRHTLRLPLQLAPGRYGLMVDGRPLGNIVVARKT
ncbi:MAG: hypothetical protein ACE5G8_17860 [Anaerolineae bacterium]